MTTRQKIELRLSEVRSRLNEIAGIEGEARTEAVEAEQTTLTTEFGELETRFQAATLADPTTEVTGDDAQGRELRALNEAAKPLAGAIFSAAIEHRQTDGEVSELQKHFGLESNQVPLSLLEHRAVTPGPTNTQSNQSEVVPGVFPASVAAYLGIDMPTVGVGDAVFPVLATNATAHTPAENAAAAETTGSFTAELLAPTRLQASFFYSREDRARLQGMGEALRMNLSEALSDGLDGEIIGGTNGLLNGTVLGNHNVTNTTTFDLYLAGLVYGRVEGKFAVESSAVRLVMGTHAYGHSGRTYRNTSVDRTALDRLQEVSGGVKVSGHVPAASSNRSNVLVRLGMRRDYIAPIWEGITLIPDEITKAGNGQIVITAVMLHATRLLRAGGFYKQQIQSS